MGALFANGRRCVSSWLRANGVSDDYQDYYYFLAPLGRKAESVASQLLVLVLQRITSGERLLAVIDDTPTKRYGPHVEGADIHHNPTPGPADQQYLYGHVWVTLSLAVRHPLWGTIALPLRALLYVRKRTLEKIPKRRGWRFHTKLEQAAELLAWWAKIATIAGKTLWAAANGAYAKRPFLNAARAWGVTVVSRLRRDAASTTCRRRLAPASADARGSTARTASAWRSGPDKREAGRQLECMIYGQPTWKLFKTFVASYPPAGGLIRVVLVLEENGSVAFFFCTDPHASVRDILEAFADRAAIEQDFHDLKEVWAPASSRCATSGPTWASIISTCGCIRWWSCGPGNVRTTSCAIAATRRGTIPNAALHTPIAVRRCGKPSFENIYPPSTPPSPCRENYTNSSNNSSISPPDNEWFSESAAQTATRLKSNINLALSN